MHKLVSLLKMQVPKDVKSYSLYSECIIQDKKRLAGDHRLLPALTLKFKGLTRQHL